MNDFLKEIDAKIAARLHYLAGKAGVAAQDCEDVVQEALADAMRQLNRGQFRGESSLGTWLQRILSGKIADYWRGKGRNPTLVPECAADGRAHQSSDTAQAIDRVSDRRQDHELVLAVRQALGRLDPIHRLVLSLSQYGGYTCKQIAKRLGRPPGTIDRILAEAKHRFRAHFVGEESTSSRRLLKGVAGEPREAEPKKND
jgi:RNA polymerase sigma-70 factor, ECF subfamily